VRGGSLKNVVAKNEANPLIKTRLAKAIAEAMIFLHANKVIHRDLKPENVLVRQFY
jgi:serine/threonine protein kinase